MEVRVVGFIPPIIGIEGEFNTFRLGGFFAKRLSPGEEVFLLNEKEKIVVGRAAVISIATGKLEDMCREHGHANHTELANPREGADVRLMTTITRICGPHIATPAKKTTVIYMKRIE